MIDDEASTGGWPVRFTGCLCWLLLVASGPLSALDAVAQERTVYGVDVAVRSRYEWRGITRRGGWTIQPDLFVSRRIGWPHVTVGAWTNIELGPVTGDRISFGRHCCGEVNLWIEAWNSVGPFDLAAGWTRYLFYTDDTAPVDPTSVTNLAEFRSTQEFYGRVRVHTLPIVVPEVAVFYDGEDVDGSYVEAKLTVRAPVWPGLQVPVNSLLLTATTGWSLGQEVDAGSDDFGYFTRRGLTHIDASVATVVGYVEFGPVASTVFLEFHLQHGDQLATRVSSPTNRDDAFRSWFGITFSVIGPRCQPTREVCR